MGTVPHYLEKCRNVLWAFTPSGIVLHNFERSTFVELDAFQEAVWARLDGIHGIADIERELQAAGLLGAGNTGVVGQTVEMLLSGGYLVRREG